VIAFDVNVLLQAFMPRSPHHERCRALVEEVANAGAPFAVSEIVLAAVVRIATNPRVFKPPASPALAFEFAEALRAHPHAVPIAPGVRHWRTFRELVETTGIRGSDVTDAYLAALAIEHGCEWWTADVDFGRFPGPRWRNALESVPVARG
jgi:toxin-antitoxin system PIN domain toxin